MSSDTIIIAIILIAGIGIIAWLVSRPKKTQEDGAGMQLLNQNVQAIQQRLDSANKETRESVQNQMRDSIKIIEGVTEKLTKLDETNRQVVGFADQLKDLQDILKNPKQRGILGEFYLEEILKNILPPSSYQMQYKFKDGEIVDAVIFLKDQIVPIDAKFSLENYERILDERDDVRRLELEKAFKQDLKNRIDETSKYIRPKEGTLDFAFMFIPAEAIYYDLLVNKVGAIKISTRDLIEYAFKERRVIIVSPTSFHAYLQTVLQGLRALQIEESAKEIRKNVEQLQRRLLNYQSYQEKLGNQIGTVVNTYNSSNKEFAKIDKDLYKITGSGGEHETIALEAPKKDD
ncbi:MAG: DNA recombination protein RmuC [Patescibacteria group bacterium]|jgi:DNA recombination protein RmuC